MIITIIIAFIFIHINAPICMWVLLALYFILKMKKAATEIKNSASLAIALLIYTAVDAQIIRADPLYVSPEEPVAANLLLDSFPGAAVAYSLRKLDKDYTGSAIRVRRSSDNTEQDIGFVNNYLDTAAMKTFVGANNGFVVTWYNQADSSGVFGVRNATQTTAANQPQIIASGNVFYRDGSVSIDFDGANDVLTIDNSKATMKYLHNGTSSSVFLALNTDLIGTYAIYGSNGASSSAIGASMYSEPTFKLTFDISRGASGFVALLTSANNIITASTFIASVLYDADNSTAANRLLPYINGGASTIGTNAQTNAISTLDATNNFQLGAAGNNIAPLNGSYKEFVSYNSDQSSNRTAIRNNINSFYSIY